MEKTVGTGKGRKTTVVILSIALVLAVLALLADMVLGTSVFTMLRGPSYSMSVKSPDGGYEAYVANEPGAVDGPNQVLYVETSDKRNVIYVGALACDVDVIREIKWSPDGSIVVFRSRDWITAVRVSDWKTVRVALGKMWGRTQPSRMSTFSTGGYQEVDDISFPSKGIVSYKLHGQREAGSIKM